MLEEERLEDTEALEERLELEELELNTLEERLELETLEDRLELEMLDDREELAVPPKWVASFEVALIPLVPLIKVCPQLLNEEGFQLLTMSSWTQQLPLSREWVLGSMPRGEEQASTPLRIWVAQVIGMGLKRADKMALVIITDLMPLPSEEMYLMGFTQLQQAGIPTGLDIFQAMCIQAAAIRDLTGN